MTATKSLLKERASTHGSFAANAATSLRIQEALKSCADGCGAQLPDRVWSALQMVSVKLARIVSHPDGHKVQDHFDDCIGYLTLARDGDPE